MTRSKTTAGKVVAVRRAVVDVAFEAAELPRLDEALVVDWDRPETLIVEVQAHLDERTVRGVALQATSGLKRGVPVHSSGYPVTVPVGDALLGRLLDVTGAVRDGGPPLPAGMSRAPIHRTAPPLSERSPANALTAARNNTETMQRALSQRERQIRQDEITTEIVELAAGGEAL